MCTWLGNKALIVMDATAVQLQQNKAKEHLAHHFCLVYVCPGRRKHLHHGCVSFVTGGEERGPASLRVYNTISARDV